MALFFYGVFMKYLKPNFSYHPLNLFFVLLIGFGAFAYTSLALAFEADDTYNEGYFWSNASNWVAPTVDNGCLYFSGGCRTKIKITDTHWKIYPAPSGSGKDMYKTLCNGSHSSMWYCGAPDPVNNCPEFGTVKRVSKLINGSMVDGVFVPKSDDGVTTIEIGGGGVVDGCGYAVPAGDNAVGFDADKDISCKPSSAGPMCYRFENMIATGELASPLPDGPSTEISDSENPVEDGAAKTQLETTSDKVVGDVTVTDMAGVSSKTQTTTETLVKEKGAVVVDSQETSVVTVSDGIYRTVTTTVNTLDFPDGTQQVITDTNTAYTQTPKTIFNIDKSTGTTNITVQGGSSADYSVTETKDYDADGNETGSKTEESGSGDGEAEEEKESEECKADPEKCKEDEFSKTQKGSFDLIALAAAMDDAEGEYREYVEILQGEVEEKIGIQFSGGSGSIDSNVINVRGATGDIGLTKWIPFLDDFGLAALILFLAAMYSAYILLGGNRD